jgi:hypothetical protein
MPDYSQGKIYRIRSKNCPEVYVGSTTQELDQRLKGHLKKCKRYLLGIGNYISSCEIIIWGELIIELIENYPCDSKIDLYQREGYWIRQEEYSVNINKNHSYETRINNNKQYMKQWRELNPNKYVKTKQTYYDQHKEYLQEKARIWKQENRDHINELARQRRRLKKQSAVIQSK